MRNDNPKVSVILPMYAVEDYVGACVESLLAQTFADFEVVCIDDGSPDRSAEVARAAAGTDARFRFFTRANGGLSAARNFGIDRARGEYLVFLDSDDLYVPEALELLYLTAQADDLDYLDFTAHTFYESAHLKRILNEDYFEQRTSIPGVMGGRELFCRYEQLDEYCCPACFHFFKRSLLDRVELAGTSGSSGSGSLRFVEGIIHEDELFSPLLLAHAERAAFLNEPLYLRRMRGGSIMNTKRGMRNVKCMLFVARELEGWLRTYARREGADRAFVHALAERIALLDSIAVTDALGVDAAELQAHADGLAGDDLVDFELAVRGGQHVFGKYRVELDWRRLRKAAHAVLDGPIALADSLADLRNRPA